MTQTDLIVIIETGQFAQDSDDIIKYVDPSFTIIVFFTCLLYTSPSPRDVEESRMPSSA